MLAGALPMRCSSRRSCPHQPFPPQPPRRKYNYVHWVAQKVDGDYADAHMGFVIMETDDDEEETLEDEESHADELLGACKEAGVA